jgi:hypothetical protein
MKIIRPEVWGHWLNEKILVGSSRGCRVEFTAFFISYSFGGRKERREGACNVVVDRLSSMVVAKPASTFVNRCVTKFHVSFTVHLVTN